MPRSEFPVAPVRRIGGWKMWPKAGNGRRRAQFFPQPASAKPRRKYAALRCIPSVNPSRYFNFTRRHGGLQLSMRKLPAAHCMKNGFAACTRTPASFRKAPYHWSTQAGIAERTHSCWGKNEKHPASPIEPARNKFLYFRADGLRASSMDLQSMPPPRWHQRVHIGG